MIRPWAVTAILMILIPGPVAHGQDAPAVPPTPGTLSVSFYLPDGGGGGIGAWRQMGSRFSLGLEMEGSYNKQKRKVFNQAVSVEGEGRTRSILVGPSLKRYWDPTARVAPFLYLHTGFGFSEVDTRQPRGYGEDLDDEHQDAHVGASPQPLLLRAACHGRLEIRGGRALEWDQGTASGSNERPGKDCNGEE
jgi:hypothetical protein